jgi:hypothetical protein
MIGPLAAFTGADLTSYPVASSTSTRSPHKRQDCILVTHSLSDKLGAAGRRRGRPACRFDNRSMIAVAP